MGFWHGIICTVNVKNKLLKSVEKHSLSADKHKDKTCDPKVLKVHIIVISEEM